MSLRLLDMDQAHRHQLPRPHHTQSSGRVWLCLAAGLRWCRCVWRVRVFCCVHFSRVGLSIYRNSCRCDLMRIGFAAAVVTTASQFVYTCSVAALLQVVDLQWELQRRGLSAAQAAHLLDAGLGLRLAVHVGSRCVKRASAHLGNWWAGGGAARCWRAGRQTYRTCKRRMPPSCDSCLPVYLPCGVRWDSPGECAMALRLDEGPTAGPGGAGDAAPSLQAYVARPTRTLVYLEREHMRRGVWEEVEHVVPACPRGFRRAVVMLRGRRAPVPVHAQAPATAMQQPRHGLPGGGDGAGAGIGAGVGGGAGAAEDTVALDVEPPTRFCGAKFASAQLVFC